MRFLPFAALLAILPTLAWAAPTDAEQGGAAAAKPSPGPGRTATPPSNQARSLSRALVPRQTWDRLLDRSAEGLSQAVSSSMANKGKQAPGDLQGNIRRELEQSMKYESAVETQAQALEKRFTPREMESAARFYQSPVGQKMLQHLPEAQSEVGDALQEQLAVVVPDILHRIAPGALEPPASEGVGAGPDGAAPSAPSTP